HQPTRGVVVSMTVVVDVVVVVDASVGEETLLASLNNDVGMVLALAKNDVSPTTSDGGCVVNNTETKGTFAGTFICTLISYNNNWTE
ncbi:unnamed protein product, partial [Adineta steineri]